MAANASSAADAAPVADAPKSSFSLPTFPEVSASSPSQALTKAGDILVTTVAAISSKAGEAFGLFGTVAAHHTFLGCAYFERFHNQKIKAFFRETVYADTREKIVINWVLNKATKGDPHSVLASIDSYSASEENLYQIGCREKAAVFDSIATAVVRDGPSKKIKQAPVFLDLGTNLGYNAIKMGIHAAKCNGHVYTIESDAQRFHAAKTIIEHAGLSKIVTVLRGVAADVIPNLKRDFGVAIVDLMFLDHSAASYVSDVAVASAQNFLAAGSRVVANHVLFPGVSGYTDAMNRDLNFDTVVHTVVLEYNCLISDNLVESTRLAEAKEPAQSGPIFDPLSSISGLGSKVTGAGTEAFGSVSSHIPDFSISDKFNSMFSSNEAQQPVRHAREDIREVRAGPPIRSI